MQGQYNLRSPAVKRLMREAQELSEPTELFYAQPLEDNLFEWHFTIRGPADSEFEGGVYHGRIILPPEYPMKPPSIMLLTPNGRFEIYKKICLSISGHHPESWQPSWSIRTAMLAIVGFMPTHGHGAIGSLDYSPDERKILARKSADWKCPNCGSVKNALKPVTEASKKDTEEAKELAAQIDFQGEKEKKKEDQRSKEKGKNPGSAEVSENASSSCANVTTNQPAAGLTAINYSQFYGGSFPAMPQHMPTMPYIPPHLFRPPGNDNKNSQAMSLNRPGMAQVPRLRMIYPQFNSANISSNPSVNQQGIATTKPESSKSSDRNPSVASSTNDSQSSNAAGSDNVATAPPVVPETTVAQPESPRLRQRNAPAQGDQTNQPAELPAQQNPQQRGMSLLQYLSSENKFILLLMALLTLAIAVLVARRIFMMHVRKFDTDFNH